MPSGVYPRKSNFTEYYNSQVERLHPVVYDYWKCGDGNYFTIAGTAEEAKKSFTCYACKKVCPGLIHEETAEQAVV